MQPLQYAHTDDYFGECFGGSPAYTENVNCTANLRFVFGDDVGVLTCNVGDGSGVRSKVMQVSSVNEELALRKFLE